ncbi:MAG TPA: hypothetical protein VHE35_27965, partial [Kofleriaceae bacterium]|nr:hypothetical protein [Kofleriaceae bacterium]
VRAEPRRPDVACAHGAPSTAGPHHPIAALALRSRIISSAPPAIGPDDLSADVRRQLWYHLDSPEKLAILQHARTAARPWTIDDAMAQLGLPERAVSAATFGLCQADVLRCASDTYEATSKALVLGAAVDVVQRAYGTDASQVLRAITRLAHGRAAS